MFRAGDVSVHQACCIHTLFIYSNLMIVKYDFQLSQQYEKKILLCKYHHLLRGTIFDDTFCLKCPQCRESQEVSSFPADVLNKVNKSSNLPSSSVDRLTDRLDMTLIVLSGP